MTGSAGTPALALPKTPGVAAEPQILAGGRGHNLLKD